MHYTNRPVTDDVETRIRQFRSALGAFATGVTIDKHVDLTHISADMQPIVQMITFADGGGTNNAAPGG